MVVGEIDGAQVKPALLEKGGLASVPFSVLTRHWIAPNQPAHSGYFRGFSLSKPIKTHNFLAMLPIPCTVASEDG